MLIRSVLVPLDLTPLSTRALKLGLELCRRFDARLVLECNLAPGASPELASNWRRLERRLCDTLAGMPPGVAPDIRLTRGPRDAALLEVAEAESVDLVVMGCHDGPTEGPSLSEKLLDEARCALLAFGAEAELPGFGDEFAAVVSLDLSSRSLTTVRQVLELQERVALAPTLVHVLHPASAPGQEDAARHQLEALLPQSRRAPGAADVRRGDVLDEILRSAGQAAAKLIFFGCHRGRTQDRYFDARLARALLDRASCAVWFDPASRAEAYAPMSLAS
jgi:nucleotide-binding universal stress UspA family protein